MGWAGAIVVYSVCWFVCLLVILPRGVQTQFESGKVEPGTPEGAPAEINLWRKALWTTLVALIPFGIFWSILTFDLFTSDDFDFLYPSSFKEAPQ